MEDLKLNFPTNISECFRLTDSWATLYKRSVWVWATFKLGMTELTLYGLMLTDKSINFIIWGEISRFTFGERIKDSSYSHTCVAVFTVVSKSKLLYDWRSVCMSRCRAHSGTCDQILLAVSKFLYKSCCIASVGAPFLTRGRVCSLQCNHSP
jgi:hypothetical protein